MTGTVKCDEAVSPDCPGHSTWEKYSDCLTAAFMSADADESTGTCDGFGTWVGLFLQDESETIDYPDCGTDIKVTIPAGTYWIIRENDQGFVYRDVFDTADKAQSAFDEWDKAYGLWVEAEEARESEIISSTMIAGVW